MNYYPQTQTGVNAYQRYNTQQQLPIGLKGRPVSSLEEVRATGIDFDGSIFYFPDLADNRIYTKQINMDGTATLNMYEKKELPDPASGEFVTREELNSLIGTLQQQFAAALSAVKPAEPVQAPAADSKPAQKVEYNF